MSTGYGDQYPDRFCVFDGVNAFALTPETLMSEINTAITSYEYVHATALLNDPSYSAQLKNKNPPEVYNNNDDDLMMPHYDALTADKAYKAGCAALAAGKLDKALQSLNVSLSNCPPNKTSAVAKLQSLISLTSQQLNIKKTSK